MCHQTFDTYVHVEDDQWAILGADGTGTDHFLEGVIRRDPVDRDVLTVADISCNAHYAFPNNAGAESSAKPNPDRLAFTGAQYYETTGA